MLVQRGHIARYLQRSGVVRREVIIDRTAATGWRVHVIGDRLTAVRAKWGKGIGGARTVGVCARAQSTAH